MGPPKAAMDPNAVHLIYMKVIGGEPAAQAALAPKCSPLGMPPKKVGEDIQKATQKWKGIKVYVEIRVQAKQATVTVMPTAAALVLQALKEPPRDRKKVKNILGTCMSIGCTVDKKSPKDVQREIDDGEH